METFNLKTASTYINNLLLARGLLRDGNPIEFAHPSRGEGGKEATMAQIINLVHDLVLKRDRDQEQRENLAGTLRSLRSESTRQTVALEKLQTRNDDLSRQISLAQSQERSARAALRTAESSARGLREEMLRLKSTVQQVRTSCANDIRKRDVQMQRLKTHLTGQQRGNRTGIVGASITINPGTTGLSAMGSVREDTLDVDDPAYSLKQETTEFLTQLSQNLSDENDNLIGLVRSTLVTLKELQGMSEIPRHEDEDAALGTIGEEDEDTAQGMMHGLPTSYETLSTDMDTVLENLRSLLTNPNFVSVDEVEMREEEIVKLRRGWDMMETRWRDTLALMEGWRRRMADGGDTINLEDLKMGLGLGFGGGLGAADSRDVSVITEEDEYDEEGGSSVLDETLGEEEELEEPPSPEADHIPEKTAGSDMFKLQLQRDLPQPALREGSGNIRSPRKVAFSASIPNTPSEIVDENVKEGASKLDLVDATKGPRTASPSKTSRSVEQTRLPASQDSRIPRQVRCDSIADRVVRLASKVVFSSSPSPSPSKLTTGLYIDESQAKKRLSDANDHPEERSPKLTVHDKLKAVQAEAEAAAVAEGLSPVRSQPQATRNDDVEGGEKRQRPRSPVKSPMKTRVTGRPRRRKSTLTPEELEDLLGYV